MPYPFQFNINLRKTALYSYVTICPFISLSQLRGHITDHFLGITNNEIHAFSMQFADEVTSHIPSDNIISLWKRKRIKHRYQK